MLTLPSTIFHYFADFVLSGFEKNEHRHNHTDQKFLQPTTNKKKKKNAKSSVGIVPRTCIFLFWINVAYVARDNDRYIIVLKINVLFYLYYFLQDKVLFYFLVPLNWFVQSARSTGTIKDIPKLMWQESNSLQHIFSFIFSWYKSVNVVNKNQNSHFALCFSNAFDIYIYIYTH